MKTYKHWSQVLVDATSTFEFRNKRGLEKLSSLTVDEIETSELKQLYGEAARSIVEPYYYLYDSGNQELMCEYDKMLENDPSEVVLFTCLQYLENKDWKHVYELMLEYGY